ncbi:PREDICTED: importin-9-like [Nicrophorus vespilloides]|uniref:Importin-9-like n=1 Tax=Nicrophorus vespilloides TaxID=110193 RepID=A0ABM1MHY4_NICVS|nr:PREDICTED: importin-9-like [Nicrophorus vespilloides]
MTEKNIKNNILTVISGLMCDESDLRKVSEDRRKALEFTEEYPIQLIDIMMDFGEHIEERLMSSILLKQYIVAYWPSEDKSLGLPVVSPDTKEKIKKFLPVGIGDSNRQLRQSTAHIMAHIAALDYPDRWPNMMNLVQQMLQSASTEVIEGAVLFLKECLPYDIVKQLGPTLFNCLYEILGNEKYSTYVRATVISLISIFLLTDLEKTDNRQNEQILIEASKKFCGLLAYQLNQPYCEQSDFHLKSEIIGGAFIQFLYCEKAGETAQLIMSTLPIIWEILSKCATEYVQIISNSKALPIDADEDQHYPKYFMKLVNNIFVLVQIIVSDNNMCKQLSPILSDIFYSIMIFMSITPALEQEFIEDEHSYCADEFNNMVNNNLRTDLKTLLSILMSHLPSDKILVDLSIAINKILGGCYEIKPNDSLNWRVNESVMCTISCLSDVFKSRTDHHESFNIYLYLRNASLIVLECRNVILLARIMLVVGRFSCCMSSEQVVEHLSAICVHLRSSDHILRNAAIRALNYHCQRISNLRGNCSQHGSEDMQKQHLQAFANVFNSLLDSLINVAAYLNPMIFGTTIRNICDITNMNQDMTANFANRLVPFILNTVAKNTQNAVIINRCKELIVGLSKNQIVAEYIQSSLMAPLIEMISFPNGNTHLDRTESQSVALYVLSIIIENAHSETIRHALFMQGYMVVIKTVNSLDDLVITEMGTRCICMYLIKCQTQLAMFAQADVDNLMNVIYRLLEPTRDEFACKHIDKLIICAFRALSEQTARCNEMLIKSILSKLNFSQSLEIRESFSIIFLHYLYYDNEVILSLLNKVPGPTGGSALSYIIKLIVSFKYVRSMYGKYLHMLVLCKILENTVMRKDSRIIDLTISDQQESGIKEVPILSYIFRYLAEKYVTLKKDQNNQPDEDSEEYEDGEDAEVEDETEADPFVDLCSVSREQINQKLVEEYLVNYMRNFSGHESFKELADTSLNDEQRQTLYSQLFEALPVSYY